ncbi:MAG: sialidase family protein [Pirellulales bacterium]
MRILILALAVVLWIGAASQTPAADPPYSPAGQRGVVGVEFLYETAPFPECHASTIVDTPTGLVAALFGGTREQHPDVVIWVLRHDGSTWSAPVEAAHGRQPDGERFPCWNPVLYQIPQGPLALYYKVGPSPSTWWGMLTQSTDGGRTWQPPVRLPDDIVGPVRNKPVLLPDGRLLCGASTEDRGWRVHMEWTADQGKHWERTPALNDGSTLHAIQPTILTHPGGRLQILCRSRGLGKVVSSTSSDAGRTWTPLEPLDLPNPNSGIDGVTLRDGRHLLVYNHTAKGRSPLNVALSRDGQSWQSVLDLERDRGEYSYPAVIQAADGRVHITYTWKRQRVRHVTLDPSQL